jgi:transcriptional regulator with XRE-family HTH domain
MAHIGQEIRRVREERGLNQAQLAVVVGTGPAAISRIENGRQSPNTETLQRIARALDVDVGNLFPKGQSPLPFENEERRTRPFGMVHELVTRQIEEDGQAVTRAVESGRIQDSLVRHENEAMKRLLEYPPEEVAELCVDLMRDRVHLERELERLESRRGSSAGTGDDVYLEAMQKAFAEMEAGTKLNRARTE